MRDFSQWNETFQPWISSLKRKLRTISSFDLPSFYEPGDSQIGWSSGLGLLFPKTWHLDKGQLLLEGFFWTDLFWKAYLTWVIVLVHGCSQVLLIFSILPYLMSVASYSPASHLVTKISLWSFLSSWNWIFKLFKLIWSPWLSPEFLVPLASGSRSFGLLGSTWPQALIMAHALIHPWLYSPGLIVNRQPCLFMCSSHLSPIIKRKGGRTLNVSEVILEVNFSQRFPFPLSGGRKFLFYFIILGPRHIVLDTHPRKPQGDCHLKVLVFFSLSCRHTEHISMVLGHGLSNLLRFPCFWKKTFYWCSGFCTITQTPHNIP